MGYKAMFAACVVGLLGLVASGGCATTGAKVKRPAKPPTCKVEFIAAEQPADAVRLGQVALDDVPEGFTPAVKRRLRPLVCEMGGDAVVLGFYGENATGRRGVYQVLGRPQQATAVRGE